MPLIRRSQLETALIHGIVTMALELVEEDERSRGSPNDSDIVLSLLSQAGYRFRHVRGTRGGVHHGWIELAYPDRTYEYILDLSAPGSHGHVVVNKASPEAGVYLGRTVES